MKTRMSFNAFYHFSICMDSLVFLLRSFRWAANWSVYHDLSPSLILRLRLNKRSHFYHWCHRFCKFWQTMIDVQPNICLTCEQYSYQLHQLEQQQSNDSKGASKNICILRFIINCVNTALEHNVQRLCKHLA